MTSVEAQKALGYATLHFPILQAQAKKPVAVKLWIENLSPYDYADAIEAIKIYYLNNTNKTFPNFTELFQAVEDHIRRKRAAHRFDPLEDAVLRLPTDLDRNIGLVYLDLIRAILARKMAYDEKRIAERFDEVAVQHPDMADELEHERLKWAPIDIEGDDEFF